MCSNRYRRNTACASVLAVRTVYRIQKRYKHLLFHRHYYSLFLLCFADDVYKFQIHYKSVFNCTSDKLCALIYSITTTFNRLATCLAKQFINLLIIFRFDVIYAELNGIESLCCRANWIYILFPNDLIFCIWMRAWIVWKWWTEENKGKRNLQAGK